MIIEDLGFDLVAEFNKGLQSEDSIVRIHKCSYIPSCYYVGFKYDPYINKDMETRVEELQDKFYIRLKNFIESKGLCNIVIRRNKYHTFSVDRIDSEEDLSA